MTIEIVIDKDILREKLSIKDGRDGFDGKDGENPNPTLVKELLELDLPELGEPIRDALEILEDGQKLSIDAIQDLRKELDEIKKLRTNKPFNGGIVGRDIIKEIDISSQFNGVLTTFSIPSSWNILSVSLSSYPYGSLRKGIDYTHDSANSTIIFASTIDPATQLSEGQQGILVVVTG